MGGAGCLSVLLWRLLEADRGSDGEGEDDGAGRIGGVACETRVAAAEEICVHVCVTLHCVWAGNGSLSVPPRVSRSERRGPSVAFDGMGGP